MTHGADSGAFREAQNGTELIRLAVRRLREGAEYLDLVRRSKDLELEGVLRAVAERGEPTALHPIEAEYLASLLTRFDPITDQRRILDAAGDSPQPPAGWVPRRLSYFVEILAQPDACPSCKAQEGRRIPLEEYAREPLLPCPGCTCPVGDPRNGLCLCCLFTTIGPAPSEASGPVGGPNS